MDCYAVICLAVVTSNGTITYHPGVETVRAIDTATGNALWQELHTKQDATPEWFADWCTRVPSFGCGCQSWLAEYLVGHPPRYEDFYEWGVECHDAVNAKLGKPDWDHVAQST